MYVQNDRVHGCNPSVTTMICNIGCLIATDDQTVKKIACYPIAMCI